MCGIAGWIGKITTREQVAIRMKDSMLHRGPDEQHIKHFDISTLIHNRLSIIDLSSAGGQPMRNEDGSVWVVFNGEIYNHMELRREMETKGHTFRGRSDTEVLPHLYEEYGIKFLDRLRGMFAIAIHDGRKKSILLARDRFGIKPLFYAPGARQLVFASEINAIRKVPGVNLQPNRQAIFDFASLFYIPAPATFYTGINSLRPGEFLEARIIHEKLVWSVNSFYKPSITPDFSITLEKAVEQADELLTKAVQNQLESDVPLGALLSGGIDSSLICAAAQQDVGKGIQSFNVRFPDAQYDETWAALAVANHIKSRHITLDMNESKGTWEHVTALLLHPGQPFADTSLFAVNSVCHLMRQHVTVALSGDGGDEGFGGYNLFWQIDRIRQMQKMPELLKKLALGFIAPFSHLGLLGNSFPQRFREMIAADDVQIIQNLSCWIREKELMELCQSKEFLPIRRFFEPQWEYHLPSGKGMERLSALATEISIRLTLPNDFLFKVDIASMKESLEIRVPMLNEDLLAFGLTLPHILKVNGRQCKRILRAVAMKKLPIAVARKPKKGFGIPVDKWVDDEFIKRLQETLLSPTTRLQEFFDPRVYQPWIKSFCEKRSVNGISRQSLYQRVIMLLSVELFLNNNLK